MSLQRQRTESTSVVNRIRSDSNRTGVQSIQAEIIDESEFLNHPVESRARTAQLPPVMVGLLEKLEASFCVADIE